MAALKKCIYHKSEMMGLFQVQINRGEIDWVIFIHLMYKLRSKIVCRFMLM